MKILFCDSGRARESNVGEKNIASSSGWAIKRHILLARRVGKPDVMNAVKSQVPIRRSGIWAKRR
jgi:hypothetical protein